MGKCFLVTFRPLELFAFGSERYFDFKYRDNKTDPTFSTYFVTTNPVPEQTTVFGTLRYCLLEKQGLTKANFDYSKSERQEIADLIGSESFRFEAKEQAFGQIQSMSPVFILKQETDGDQVIITNPFNNCCQKAFRPMVLTTETVETSRGKLALVGAKDYNVKNGYGQEFYNVSRDVKVNTNKLFRSTVLTGNSRSSHDDGENDKQDFFKRQVYHMAEKHSFAVYLTLKPEATVALDGYSCFAMMGQKKSLFQVTFEEVSTESHLDAVTSALAQRTPEGMVWHYALSDSYYGNKGYRYGGFAIVEKKSLRNLETNLSEDRLVTRIRRSNKQFNLIKRGSVFYGQPPQSEALPEHYQVIGLNHIVEIKGEKK